MAFINNVTDTLYADVSEFQVPVDDSYTAAGYRTLCIRSSDGTYQDHHFAQNYQWCVRAVEDGRMVFFLVYAYWRPNWQATAQTLIDMVKAQGGPHPRMSVMLDLESGGNPGGDQSDPVNRCYWEWANWLGDPARVIGYGNSADLTSMWRTRPSGLGLVVAGYGRKPNLSGQISHQYTDGQGYGGGLPEGAPPFGHCDMNSADGLGIYDFAAACGIQTVPPPGPNPLPSGTGELPADDAIFQASGVLVGQFYGS